MPIATTPPPITASAPKPPTARQTKTAKARTEAVNGIWQLAGFGCMFTGNLADAGAISKHSPAITTELVNLAENDEKVANVIDKLANIGPYGAIMTAMIPMALQILVNHDRFKASPATAQMGVVPRAALEAEIHMAMAEAEMHAQMMQQEAEEQLARVKAAMEAKSNPNGQAASG